MVWQTGHLLNNGKYEILEVLGRGGFALTYKARHQQLAMEVVIKTPDILQKRDTEYEDYVKQFEAEGRKLAKFSQTPHPHIVRVWDIFMEGQVPCLVMDFIQGQTLMEKVKTQGKLSEAECLEYIRQIGSALEEVHQTGMVHRDAHPGNIMIQPNGNAILIDFGIAKEIIPASSSSTDYAANPSFAPYEQIYKGSKANRQPSVDIYALAASFYYAVTGERPTPSMERRLEDRPLKSPKEINRNLSEHLNTAITLGMALEKENRPQSMSDWLQQLELPPSPVESKYRREKVNPPQPKKEPEELKQKATVNPKSSENSIQEKLEDIPLGWLIRQANVNLISAQNSIQEKPKNIPWVGLIGVFFLHGLTGFFLGLSLAPWRVWGWVLCGAVGGILLVTVGRGWDWNKNKNKNMATLWGWDWRRTFGVWGGALAMAASEALNLVVALDSSGVLGVDGSVLVTVGVGGSVLVTVAWAWVAEILLKYFSRFHSFLILAVTNLSGLGSGWLFAFLLHPKG